MAIIPLILALLLTENVYILRSIRLLQNAFHVHALSKRHFSQPITSSMVYTKDIYFFTCPLDVYFTCRLARSFESQRLLCESPPSRDVPTINVALSFCAFHFYRRLHLRIHAIKLHWDSSAWQSHSNDSTLKQDFGRILRNGQCRLGHSTVYCGRRRSPASLSG